MKNMQGFKTVLESVFKDVSSMKKQLDDAGV
jgi:hypothetical protein